MVSVASLVPIFYTSVREIAAVIKLLLLQRWELGSDFLGLNSATEMRRSAVLLVLTKHKQLLPWPFLGSSRLAQLTGNIPNFRICSASCLLVSLLLCPHRKPLLACNGVFKLAVLVMAQCPCSAFTQAGNPPIFHGVPVSFSELSCIFLWICEERMNFLQFAGKELEKCLTQQWKSPCDYSLRDMKGKGNYKRLDRHEVILNVGNLAGPG